MKFLDRLSYTFLVPVALFLTFAPFTPEPHLWQKLNMLVAGTLIKPLDIFDLFFHATPVTLLILKFVFTRHKPAGDQ
ncbi:MAG: RND transporter [Gammaproteobacteria bacterium]|nr:RND transporter [Gammaproteobacteria bacterium]